MKSRTKLRHKGVRSWADNAPFPRDGTGESTDVVSDMPMDLI
ncbi:hypothetical protein [Bradyrhizobium sp.]|jgi:hypothetical protein